MSGLRESLNRVLHVGTMSCFVFGVGVGHAQSVFTTSYVQAPSPSGANAPIPADQTRSLSSWKTFTSKGGWKIKYPPNWKISSCRQCTDFTAAHIFVMFSDPATNEYLWIEQYIDKPSDKSVEEWLNDLKQSTNLNDRLSQESISLDGRGALKVHYAKSEDIYVVNGSKSFAIRTSSRHIRDDVRRMLSSFKFTKP